MSDKPAAPQLDPVLLPLLRADGEAQSEQQLAALLANHAEAVIKQIVVYKLRITAHRQNDGQAVEDAEDVRSQVLVSLLARLRELKTDAEGATISNFRGYVATVTYNACSHHLRRKYPERHRLKQKLRYLFTHQPRLNLWEDETGDLLCGYAAWQAQNLAPASRGAVNRLLENPQSLAGGANIIDAAFQALDVLAAPVELDALVGIVAVATGVVEAQQPSMPTAADGDRLDEQIPDSAVSFATTLEQRHFLEQLWQEVSLLPLRQRLALLLNLKDEQGGNSLAFLPLTGVASLGDIAAAMELTVEELAAIWNQLPLEDRAIAERLQLTRQQVINLRKCARERLARRLPGGW